MIVLTDMGNQASDFFGRRALEEIDSPPDIAESDLTDAVFGHKTVHKLRLDAPGPATRFPLVLLVEQAPRSNLELMSHLLRQGISIPDGLVCIAYSGRGFLGRHDRSWQCEPGNLHVVVYLEPGITPDQAGVAFSIISGVACLDALLEVKPKRDDLGLKWINDIMAGSAKIGGVLSRLTYQEPCITHALLGLGVNILVAPRIPTNRFVPRTDCLKRIYPQKDWSPGDFLIDFLEHLDTRYSRLLADGAGDALDSYRGHSNILGKTVRIYEDGYGFSDETVQDRKVIASGRVEEILDDLSLKIAGVVDPIPTGRLAFEEDCLSP